MFGIRILIFLIGIALVVWILYRLYRAPAVRDKSPRKVGDMVQCEVCGTYIPRGEAVSRDQRHYCSEEHRDQDS